MACIPFSIAASVLQLVDFVCKVERDFSKACKEAERYGIQQIYGCDCREKEMEMKANAAKVIEWRNLWFSDPDRSDDFNTLWGSSGSQHIAAILRKIEALCVRIQDFSHIGLADAVVSRPPSSVDKPPWWKKPQSWIRPSSRQHVRHNGEHQIGSIVDHLSRDIEDLWDQAERHFRTINAVSSSKGSPRETEQLACVLRTKEVSTQLYWLCQSSGMGCHLDINLLNNDQEIDKFPDIFDWADLKLNYHLTFPARSASEYGGQIILEAMDEYEPCDHDGLTSCLEFQTVTDISYTDSEALVTHIPLRNALAGSYLCCNWSKSAADDNITPSVLNSTAETQRINIPSGFSDVVYLAYHLAELGLFLLGTPWLSHLSIDALRKQVDDKGNLTYHLRIDRDICQTLATFSSREAEPAQIRRLGQVLVEIALQCSGTNSLSPKRTTTLDILSDLQGVDISYSRVCTFCLEYPIRDQFVRDTSTRDERDNLQAFYHEVFIRLRDLNNSSLDLVSV